MRVKRYINGLRIESDYFESVSIKNEKFLVLMSQAKSRMSINEKIKISTKNVS